jgi:CRP-like cAMP-binding protein
MTQSQTSAADPQGSNQPMDTIRYLSASALGMGLTADELSTLVSKVELRKLSKNENLISEGDEDDHLYAIAQGEFAVTRQA